MTFLLEGQKETGKRDQDNPPSGNPNIAISILHAFQKDTLKGRRGVACCMVLHNRSEKLEDVLFDFNSFGSLQ